MPAKAIRDPRDAFEDEEVRMKRRCPRGDGGRYDNLGYRSGRVLAA